MLRSTKSLLMVGLFVALAGTNCSEQNHDSRQTETEHQEGPSTFEKPDRAFDDRQLFGETDSYETDTFSVGHVSLREGREHMAPDENHQQFWLEPGEPFILDLTYKMWGYDHHQYDLVVLANFEPIQFKMRQVEEESGFPSAEEWQQSDEVLVDSAPLEVPDHHTKGVSIYIPPNVFSAVGAYDLRIVLLNRFPSDPGDPIVRHGGFTIHHSVTLYYGGLDFPEHDAPELPDTQEVSAHRNTRLLASHGPMTTLLLPEADVYDLASLRDPMQQAELGQVFSVPSPARLLGHSIRSSFLEEERSVIVAFDGTTPLQGASGVFAPPEAPQDTVNSDDPFVVRFPIEIELRDEQIHPIRFVKFAQPFRDMHNSFDRKIEVSNTIFVQAKRE
ncbi:hypothetical protein FIV42_10330 [Persicimonas caeni]|uniref:Uncharacterized protein n=1 Tax=Persicimonas caeni TaxID=2292766 RepID=A0A4Y6PS09_PERCE|nr:hypothetical protein [Persicimonas caeni]QDG51116.1 hypothetical protein FIV42_10330 [Persicimonas caeni]QED32337.1 hypothetical protein FRD00_10325 [Persicimonas caeni]